VCERGGEVAVEREQLLMRQGGKRNETGERERAGTAVYEQWRIDTWSRSVLHARPGQSRTEWL
jgi:hypothetical protein